MFGVDILVFSFESTFMCVRGFFGIHQIKTQREKEREKEKELVFSFRAMINMTISAMNHHHHYHSHSTNQSINQSIKSDPMYRFGIEFFFTNQTISKNCIQFFLNKYRIIQYNRYIE